MPIAITPTTSYGNKIVSGTTSANALVLLKNPSSGQVVATTTADGSGDYSFSVSNSIPLQVSVPSSVDPQLQTTIDIASPATPYSDYGNDSVPLGVADFPQTTGSPAWYYNGTPTVSIVDTTGSGSGAEVSVTMADVGDPYGSYSSRVIDSALYGGIGKPLRQYTLSKLGSGYGTPKMRITGTVVFSYNGSIEQLEQATGITTGFTYNSSTYYTQLRTYDLSCWTRQIGVVGATGVEQILGSDHSTWGQYGNDYRGGRCTASFPGEQDITEPADDTSVDGATALQDLKDVVDNANYYNGSQLAAYYAIIYGQNPNDITHTGNPAAPFSGVPSNVLDGGALWAYNNGYISKQEVDLLKGYFGRKLMVEPISNNLPTTPYWNSYTVATALLGAWNIGQGVFQTSIASEWQSFSRQYNGLVISDMSQRIKPILDKITAAGGKDFNTLQTQTNNGQRVLWNFNGAVPTNSNI
jgi:hypothetical protein